MIIRIFNKYNKFLLILTVIFLATTFFYFLKYRETNLLLKGTNRISNKEARELITQVGRLIRLPENEEPTIATVVDAGNLSSEPFFQNAKNGDKILIYYRAQKVILYDPVIKKVIKAGNLQYHLTPSPEPGNY